MREVAGRRREKFYGPSSYVPSPTRKKEEEEEEDKSGEIILPTELSFSCVKVASCCRQRSIAASSASTESFMQSHRLPTGFGLFMVWMGPRD